MTSSLVEIAPLLVQQTLGKRLRDGEIPGQTLKKAKIERRKRNSGTNASVNLAVMGEEGLLQQEWYPDAPILDGEPVLSESSRTTRRATDSAQDLSQEEEARRERIRASARERQRKHRALVKERKMKALDMETGSDTTGRERAGSDEYRSLDLESPLEQFQHMLQQTAPPQSHTDALLYSQPMSTAVNLRNAQGEQPQPINGGQTFATTLLLSFSCAPMLKQHLLDSLHMTNEELASLEPYIAGAWEQWNAQRQSHHKPNPQSLSADTAQNPAASSGVEAPGIDSDSGTLSKPTIAEEFRERFSRSIDTPSPYRNGPSSSPGSGVIDPSLSGQVG
ncbi:hypothetical protein PM082_001946 [Marasmius tenuissimus]|nr:hypothetical protein PM082_015533 [Marasmius tenuissimus]KAJ8077515.1 hypothetical protein PM082_001946 [Marasmius tenuissimus]